MLIKTIKNYKDKETKLIYRTTDNCTIREVSDTRGEELIKAGVVEKLNQRLKPKSKLNQRKMMKLNQRLKTQRPRKKPLTKQRNQQKTQRPNSKNVFH